MFWIKVFSISFGMGVVSGIIMPFQFGTNWSRFSDSTANVLSPLFAYEAILNLIGMALLLYVARRYARRLFDGDIALLYIVWYGWVRSALETLRVGNWYIGPLPTATWLGLAGVLVAAAFLIPQPAPPGYADWGQLISLSHNWIAGIPGHALEFWYTLIVPGVAIFLFVLGWNLLGDAFRDIFDPRLQGSR